MSQPPAQPPELDETESGSQKLLALLIAGCAGPSVEGQEKAWHANKENIQKYSGKYKGMK